MMQPSTRSSVVSLALLGLVGSACPGGGASTESTTGSSGGVTTDEPATTGLPPTSTSAGSSGAESTGAPSSGAESTGSPVCTGPHLLSRWVVPDQKWALGVAMDDSGAVTFLGGSPSSDDYHATLVRIVDGEVAWSLTHKPAFKYVHPHGFAVRGDGVALIVGASSYDSGGVYERLPWTAAYDAAGALIFDHVTVADTCADPPCLKGENRAVVVTTGGEFLVAGEQGTYSDFEFKMAGVLRRYDATMGEVEVTEFPLPYADGEDLTRSMALRGDGSVVMFGETHMGFNSIDWWFARLAADGTFQSVDTVSADEEDIAAGVAVLDDGSIVFSAQTGKHNQIGENFAARLDPTLASVWQVPGSWYGPIVLGADNATYQTLDEYRIVEKLSGAGERMWKDDPCLDEYRANALALSPDGTKLILSRTLDRDKVVEIYDAI